ncbi:hypothetical protein LTS17_000591 [Exophiala oligosperma]
MSVKDNADVKPTTTKDEEVISLKENVHSKTVENAETPGLSDEEEDPHVSFKTWVVVWKIRLALEPDLTKFTTAARTRIFLVDVGSWFLEI